MTVLRLSVLPLCVAHLGAQSSGRINGVIDKLQQGEPVFGIFSEDRSPTNAAALNDSAIDFIIIGMEHRPLDFEFLRQFVEGMLSRNDHTSDNPLRPPALPLVRLPQNGRAQLQFPIKQALDVGAYGLVLPHIESREEALSAVRAARYFQKSGTQYYVNAGHPLLPLGVFGLRNRQARMAYAHASGKELALHFQSDYFEAGAALSGADVHLLGGRGALAWGTHG